MKATLMNKRTPVLTIYGDLEYNIKEFKMPVFVANNIDLININLCPINIANNKTELLSSDEITKAFNYWLKKRLVSDKRPDIPKNFASIHWNTQHNSKPNFFSFSDQYWIRYNEKETWDDLNFFHNGFNEIDGKIFFSKNLKNLNHLEFYFHSPDITTNGILPKRWKTIDNIPYLLKQAYLGYDQTPANEVLASRYLKAINIIPFVEYSFEIDGFTTCCKCKNFINENQEFVPAIYVYTAIKDNSQDSYYDKMKKAIDLFEIPNGLEFIDKMITVDRMLLNFDRHLGNFGFIRNVESGKFEGPAPLFDFGDAFLWNVSNENKLKMIEKNHFFSDREKYLIRTKQINPTKDICFDEDINLYPGINQEKIKELNEVIELNNNYIQNIQNEHDKKIEKNKSRNHHKNKKQNKDMDKNMNQEVCIYF